MSVATTLVNTQGESYSQKEEQHKHKTVPDIGNLAVSWTADILERENKRLLGLLTRSNLVRVTEGGSN